MRGRGRQQVVRAPFVVSRFPMKTVCTLPDLRAEARARRQAGSTIGLVPTMGALHEGHLALVRTARAMCDYVVVSIFVNPTQFGPNEDLAVYPRQLAEDSAMLEAEGAALLWAPDVTEMYPPGFSTSVSVGGVDRKGTRLNYSH